MFKLLSLADRTVMKVSKPGVPIHNVVVHLLGQRQVGLGLAVHHVHIVLHGLRVESCLL